MNIKEILLELRNAITVINVFLWIEIMRLFNNGEKVKVSEFIVEETNIGSLLLQIFILFIAPIAIAIKIIAIFLKILHKILSIRLAKNNAI